MTAYFSCSLSSSCPQNCDIKQAFVQSSLPSDETYFVKPPQGCHYTPPGTLWKLTLSLYAHSPGERSFGYALSDQE